MGDILEHWEQRVVVVVPGDLCLDHQHSDLVHLQVLLIDKAIDSNILVSHQQLAKERKEHLCGARQLPEGHSGHICSYVELSWMRLGYIKLLCVISLH